MDSNLQAFDEKINGLLDEIEHDNTSGAHVLAEKGASTLKLALTFYGRGDPALFFPRLESLLRRFLQLRPSVAPLYLLGRGPLAQLLSHKESGLGPTQVAGDLIIMLENFLRNSREAPGRIARHFAKALRQDCIALTLGSSTCVLECLRFCRQKIKEVIVAESRPLYEGRSVCRLLAGEGFSTTLITDAQMGIFAREADIAVTGADAILPTGEVINRAGTRLLALAAKDAGIPMCVLSETHKIHPGPLEGFEPLIGEEHPDQVLGDPVPGMRVRNVVYDRTPPELITALITEVGLLRQPAVLDMAKKIIGDTSQ